MANADDVLQTEKVASDACTRSGGFGLLLTVLVFLLIPYWVGKKSEDALGKYIVGRFNLILKLQALDDNPLWQEYESSNPTAESTSIEQLKIIYVSLLPKLFEKPAHPPPARPSPKGGQPKRASSPGLQPPSPPTGLTVAQMEPVTAVSEVADVFGLLNDSEMLTRSRDVSNYFNFSIVRWVDKRGSVLYKNRVNNVCANNDLQVPFTQPQSTNFVPALNSEALLKCMTLKDVRELAQFELPTVVINPPQLGEHVGRQIDLSPGALPRDPYLATILAQALLFFVTIYFGAFLRVASSCVDFPSMGTLFGAFARSRFTLFVLLVAIWSPVLASAGVAIASERLISGFCTLAIFSAVLSIHLPLQRRAYFQSLDPTRLIAGITRRFRRRPPTSTSEIGN